MKLIRNHAWAYKRKLIKIMMNIFNYIVTTSAIFYKKYSFTVITFSQYLIMI